MAHIKIKTHLASIAILIGLMIQSTTLLAQATLEEIIVTAERREASIQEVPVAVSAFTQQSMQDLQIEDTLDLVNVVPNLFGGNNTGLGSANMYYLRAQGNDESIATFDPPVGTYVDDVYVTRQNANNFSLFDVNHIEVLRGPQGTLFGRNTTGGAINIIMNKPGEVFGGFAEAGFGAFGEYFARASVDMPFSETALTKLSAFIVDSDGWLDNIVDGNTYNGKDNKGIRGSMRFLISDTTTWDLSVDYIDAAEAYIAGEIVGSKRISSSVLPGGLPPIPGWEQKSDYGSYTETLSLISNLGWDMAGGQANFIVGYRALDHDFLLNFPGLGSDDFFWIDNTSEHDMLTAELKWNATLMDDRLDLVAGLFYLDEDNTTDFADYLFGFLRLADRVLDNTADSWAAYIQGDLSVGENGTLTIGARFTDEQKKIGLSDNTGADVLTTAGLVAAGIPLKQTESNVTPRFAYAHQFREQVMGYVSATKGFKSGGWNARGTSPEAFEPFGPETLWSYELGVRSESANGRWRTNATLFYSDLSDLQTTAATPTGQFLTTNAGGLEVPGFELELTGLITDNWEVFLALGLQNAKYVDLPDDCVVPNTSLAAYDVDCNVATPKRSPDETITLGTSVNIPISSWNATLRPIASARYIGKNVTATRNQGPNDATIMVNAGVSLAADSGRWLVNLECKNCFDEEYTTSFLFVPYYTPPMSWMAKVRFNFGQ